MIRSCFILGLLNTIVYTTSRNIHWSSSICDSYPILDNLRWRSPICDSSFILSNLLLSLHTVFFCHLTGMDKGGSIRIEYKKNRIIYYNLMYDIEMKLSTIYKLYMSSFYNLHWYGFDWGGNVFCQAFFSSVSHLYTSLMGVLYNQNQVFDFDWGGCTHQNKIFQLFTLTKE